MVNNRQFSIDIKTIAGAILAVIGIVVLVITGIPSIRSLNVNSADEITSPKKGQYVIVSLENMVCTVPDGAEQDRPLCSYTASSDSDPLLTKSGFVVNICGQYRQLIFDGAIDPEVYSSLDQLSTSEVKPYNRYAAVFTDEDNDHFAELLDRVKSSNDKYYLKGEEITDIRDADANAVGLKLVKLDKVRNRPLISLPFIIIGLILIIFGKSSSIDKAEKRTQESESKK